jgi:hypothetical protein
MAMLRGLLVDSQAILFMRGTAPLERSIKKKRISLLALTQLLSDWKITSGKDCKHLFFIIFFKAMESVIIPPSPPRFTQAHQNVLGRLCFVTEQKEEKISVYWH